MINKLKYYLDLLLKTLLSSVEKYSLPLLGLFIFLFFIWLRFIRTRLPKDIPFHYVSFLRLCILIYICIIFFLAVKYLVISVQKKEKRISEYVVEFLYTPLEMFDASLKRGWDSDSFVLHLAKKLQYFIKDTNLFYWCLFILPRIILVSTLSIDVFYFQELKYIYYVLLMGIFMLLRKYIIYSFKVTKKHLIEQLSPLVSHISTRYVPGVHPEENLEDDDDDDFDIQQTMALPLDIFVDFQTKNIVYGQGAKEYSFYFIEEYYQQFKEENKIPKEQSIFKKKEHEILFEEKRSSHKNQIEDTIFLAVLTEYYNISHHNNKVFKYIKIVIFAFQEYVQKYVPQ